MKILLLGFTVALIVLVVVALLGFAYFLNNKRRLLNTEKQKTLEKENPQWGTVPQWDKNNIVSVMHRD